MTAMNDIDRLLADYLEEGPRRAPERPVDAAIAHARSHPRRRDPFLFLRRDVMATRAVAWSPQLAWVLVVLGLTLALVAVVAVGSRRDDRSVLPPPSAVDASSPSPTASPSPRAFSVDVVDSVGTTRTVTVSDASLTIVAVEPRPSSDGEPVDEIAASNDPADPSRVWITWAFDSCADPATLTIDATGTDITLERPACEGDAIGGPDLQLALVFADPVDATDLDVTLIETQ